MNQQMLSFFRRLGWYNSAPDERKLHPHIFTEKPSPPITIGSIIFYGLLKTFVIIFVLWSLTRVGYADQLWWWSMLLLWIVVFYPAMQQYKRYNDYSSSIKTETLCATCKHYDPTSIRCGLHDEHVSIYHIPCHGESWEIS